MWGIIAIVFTFFFINVQVKLLSVTKPTLIILTNGHERGVDLEKIMALVVRVLPSTTLPPLPRVK